VLHRSCFLKVGAVAAALGLGLAVPWSAGAAIPARITYSGTIQIGAAARPLQITIQGSAITTFAFPASLRCTDGGFKNWDIDSPGVGIPAGPFAIKGNSFSFSVGSLQSPDRVSGHLTGTVTPGREVAGEIHVEAYQNPAPEPTGALCSASYKWLAKPPPPLHPAAAVTFLPIALPSSKSGYSYDIAVSNIACSQGALSVQITVTGHGETTLHCDTPVESSPLVIATNVVPGAGYVITTQPLALASGRLHPQGAKQTITLRIPYFNN